MKVKIISTGEVVNIADYANVTLDKCDSYGNPIEVSFEDVELIKDTPTLPIGIKSAFKRLLRLCKGCVLTRTILIYAMNLFRKQPLYTLMIWLKD